jgi:hypothetical protein
VRYTDCNLSPGRGVHTGERRHRQRLGATVFSCDYNGWADVPEEEREGIEAFESVLQPPMAAASPPLVIRLPFPSPHRIPERRAA